MTQKITLSIPDFLHEKLEEWRASFNLSKMFQEALTEAIQKKEELQKRFKEEFDLSDVVKRLRKEKNDWEAKFYHAGRNEGLKWARSASYEDLLYVMKFKDAYELISDPKLNTYFDEVYVSSHLATYSAAGTVTHEQMFMKGWQEGVLLLWEQVKDKI